jgi:hypothetical protein
MALLPMAIHARNRRPQGEMAFQSRRRVSLTVLPALEPDALHASGPQGLKKAAWEAIHQALRESPV